MNNPQTPAQVSGTGGYRKNRVAALGAALRTATALCVIGLSVWAMPAPVFAPVFTPAWAQDADMVAPLAPAPDSAQQPPEQVTIEDVLAKQGEPAAQNPRKAYDEALVKIKAAHKPFYNAQHFTLSNGMQVVVVPNHRAPVVTHMVWYKTGGADEPFGISGTAHFLEHLLFKGSTNVAPGEFSRRVKVMGGRDNAFTSWDYTAFFQTIPSEHLESAMVMEADRIRGANPPHDHFLTERNVVLEERRQTLDNDPSSRLSEQVRQALFVNHPYGRPIIGWMNEVEALDWPAIKAFYDRWYSPSNAMLVVAGDVDVAAFKDMAERIYGAVPAFDVPERKRPPVATFDTEKSITMRDKLVRQRSFYRMALVPNMTADPYGAIVSSLVGTIMDGGMTSRLYKSIIVDQKLAIGVSVSHNPYAVNEGTIAYGGTPVDGVTFETLENAIKTELTKAAKEGFTAEELERAKTRMIDAQAFELDTVTGPAMAFGRSMIIGVEPDLIEYWPHFLALVTLEDVNAKAAELFALDDSPIWERSVYGYLLPEDAPQTPQEGEQE